ncbi:Acetyltransferase (GNAT) family protein [Terribacillus aidingensis]|uniref:Acetyltransferase (GNAT) family protein n=1 Tax=Terribacillus aidingensis TaxID=586416 RepID=A0A285P6U0_9BACI|nr:GNAT family N-acetyltransferase [Terribacillus aidingensis]SNZ17469.1 Acetyltransferase (GNAT) family protein [Terribacillus aidingensis]
MIIRKLLPSETPPMELLLEADPSETKVATYLNEGSCFIAEEEEAILGVYVMLPIKPGTAEIMNISVRASSQGKGIGKQLIRHAIHQANKDGYSSLEVGTGNSSIDQLAFYQKCGFRMTAIEPDFFLRHYEMPIYENGIQCRDMIRFVYPLTP